MTDHDKKAAARAAIESLVRRMFGDASEAAQKALGEALQADPAAAPVPTVLFPVVPAGDPLATRENVHNWTDVYAYKLERQHHKITPNEGVALGAAIDAAGIFKAVTLPGGKAAGVLETKDGFMCHPVSRAANLKVGGKQVVGFDTIATGPASYDVRFLHVPDVDEVDAWGRTLPGTLYLGGAELLATVQNLPKEGFGKAFVAAADSIGLDLKTPITAPARMAKRLRDDIAAGLFDKPDDGCDCETCGDIRREAKRTGRTYEAIQRERADKALRRMELLATVDAAIDAARPVTDRIEAAKRRSTIVTPETTSLN